MIKMENYKLLTILEDVISSELKEVDPRTAEQAAVTARRLVRGSAAEAQKVAQEIVTTMGRGGAKGEAINIFGKIDPSTKKFVKSNSPTAVTNGDDLLAALKNGAIDAENLARVNKGILKSESATSAMLQDIVGPVVRETKFVEKYGTVYVKNGEEAARKLLRENGYSQSAIDEMFKVIKTDANYGKNVANIEKNLSKAKEQGKQKDQVIAGKDQEIARLNDELRARANTNISQGGAVQTLENTSKEAAEVKPIIEANKNRIKEMSKTAFDKFKRIGKRLSAKWLLGMGLVAAGGILTLRAIFGGTTRPDSTNTIFPKCITDLLDDDGTSVTTTPAGDPVVIVTKTGNPEYDQIGGLKFFTNGRVISGDNSKKGTWKCKGGELEVKEMMNEQTDTEIDNDVNTMIDLLDFPVTGQNLQDAVSLLKKYSTSPKGKEFLDLYKDSGLGSGSLKKSLDYISTFEPTSVRAKRAMYGLISQIEGGVGVADGNKSTGVGNIDIVWDSGTKPKDDGEVIPIPKKSTYYDCSGKPLPHEFGCRSSKIKEAQICLGLPEKYQTGNFGPITKRAIEDKGIDTTNGLTQNVLDKICGGEEESTQTKRERVDIEPITTNRLKMTDLVTPTIEPKLPNINPIEVSDEQFYDALRNNGNIFARGNRVKYKGPELDEQSLSKLDNVLTKGGYTRIKQKDRDYGVKYVWEKQ
jgi:hypothetical protein